MGQISPPSRGQPLDLSFVYRLVEEVNRISAEVSPNIQQTEIDTVSAGKQMIRTSDTRIVGGYINVTNSSSTSPDGEGPFTYSFENNFAYVPIVTATPILIEEGSTESGKDITVVLTKITTSQVQGVVRFNTIGVASVGLNLLAVGIPT